MRFPRSLPLRTVGEWVLSGQRTYENPFTNVDVRGTFSSPSGRSVGVPAFYDGDGTWRLRFNPGEPGTWTFRIASTPRDPGLEAEGRFEVTPAAARGFLKSTPGRGWGFSFESGDPVFILGDTAYNLFGMAHCGVNVVAFLERRARQGFNLIRVRVPVSPFHPPEVANEWQTGRTWPWGGGEEFPMFDRFNLDYFRTVDRVVREAERLGLGFEMILEAWGTEFPFNRRDVFVPEWEALWVRYVVARYDAFNAVWIWTLQNEYEFYPDGQLRHKPVADLWALRVARLVKSVAPHGHPVAVHTGVPQVPFAGRFATDPGAIDVILFQEWGTKGKDDAWLAAGIDELAGRSLGGWWGSALLAEYGYERNPEIPMRVSWFEWLSPEHTRRGAWRGAFSGLGVVGGFENSWGPVARLDEDQPGVAALLHLWRFWTEVVPFARMRPAPELVVPEPRPFGHHPLAMASPDRAIVAVYLPAGGEVSVRFDGAVGGTATWYDPRTGDRLPASPPAVEWPATAGSPAMVRVRAPEGEAEEGRPADWVWVWRRKETGIDGHGG